VEGTLLATVLRVKPELWMENHDWAHELQNIVHEIGPLPSDHVRDDFRPLIDAFAETIASIEKRLRRARPA
jgi:hypothetical protein